MDRFIIKKPRVDVTCNTAIASSSSLRIENELEELSATTKPATDQIHRTDLGGYAGQQVCLQYDS